MRNRSIVCTSIPGLICAFAQVARCQQSGPGPPAPSELVTTSPVTIPGSHSESDVATANNPIAPMNALYFQNYYAPTLYGSLGPSNLLELRPVVVSGRQIVRATLPIASIDNENGAPQSGLGDFNVFDAIRLSPEKSNNVAAVGPLLVAPTATDRLLGQGKWQAGVAAVGVHALSHGSLLIGIFTWQHSFAGEHARPDAQLVTFQPIIALSIGGGYYVRSSSIWSFDIHNGNNLIPIGVGFGRVFNAGKAIVNAFIEPQFTVFHSGTDLPSVQLLAGLNFQFRKSRRSEARMFDPGTWRSLHSPLGSLSKLP